MTNDESRMTKPERNPKKGSPSPDPTTDALNLWETAMSALAIVAVLSGCGPPSSESPKDTAPPLSVQVILPKRGPITRTIILPGEVKAFQQATLYAKVGGYLKTITVDKGDSVKAGDLIADIEVPELLADRAKYKAEVEGAALDYNRLVEAQKKPPRLVRPQSASHAQGNVG